MKNNLPTPSKEDIVLIIEAIEKHGTMDDNGYTEGNLAELLKNAFSKLPLRGENNFFDYLKYLNQIGYGYDCKKVKDNIVYFIATRKGIIDILEKPW